MFFVFSEFGMSLDLSGYNLFLLKLKTENWKHCSRIIFKCVNSIVEPIFNIFILNKVAVGPMNSA